MKENIEKFFLEISEIIKSSTNLSTEIEQAVEVITNSIKNGNKVILFGNGGSAADAQHIAAEFIARFQKERDSYPAIALTTDTSIITSISNDYSFDEVFSRQCESLVNSGDVVIGISTSGTSKNVVKGFEVSKQKGAHTIALLGNSGGTIKNLVDISLIVNSTITARIQEVHRVIYHIVCDIVEKQLTE